MMNRFSKSEVKGQGHNQTECGIGGGMHSDDVAWRLTRLILAVFKWRHQGWCHPVR